MAIATAPDHLPTQGGIELRGVAKAFPTGRRSTLQALADVTFGVEPGEFVSLLGPSGCGKSTALRMATGLEEPTGGEVAVLGGPPSHAVAAHRLGIAFQDHALLPHAIDEAVLLSDALEDRLTHALLATQHAAA